MPESTTKKYQESTLNNTIQLALSLTIKRLITYAAIIIITIYSVYSIIDSPNFLYGALSFQPIEDEVAEKELTNLSNIIYDLREEKVREISRRDEASDFQAKINKMEVDKINYIIKNNVSIRVNTSETELSELLKLSKSKSKSSISISITYRDFGGLSRLDDDLLFLGEVPFTQKAIQDIVDDDRRFFRPNNDNKKSELITHIKSLEGIKLLEGIEATFITDFESLLKDDIAGLTKKIKSIEKELEESNEEIGKIVKRLRSDEYIYGAVAVVLQKTMFTMLIVYIGLYFLKAIGADLLFLRKLTIINVCQELVNSSNPDSPLNSIDVYNSLASEAEKSGKSPDTIAIKTLTQISRILTQKNKS